jgi:hypothetical protein
MPCASIATASSGCALASTPRHSVVSTNSPRWDTSDHVASGIAASSLAWRSRSNPGASLRHAPANSADAVHRSDHDGDHVSGSAKRSPSLRRSGSNNATHSAARSGGRIASARTASTARPARRALAAAYGATSASRSPATTRSPRAASASASAPSPHVASNTTRPPTCSAMRDARQRATDSCVACSSPLRVNQCSAPLGDLRAARGRSTRCSRTRRASSAPNRFRSRSSATSSLASAGNASSAASTAAENSGSWDSMGSHLPSVDHAAKGVCPLFRRRRHVDAKRSATRTHLDGFWVPVAGCKIRPRRPLHRTRIRRKNHALRCVLVRIRAVVSVRLRAGAHRRRSRRRGARRRCSGRRRRDLGETS